MSMEHPPGDTGAPPPRGRRGASDGGEFVPYSFHRRDRGFRRPAGDERRAAGTEFIELVRKWESSEDLILRTYSLVGLRAGVDFMLWQIAFDPLSFQSMEAA